MFKEVHNATIRFHKWDEYRKETKNNHGDLEIFMAFHSLCFAGTSSSSSPVSESASQASEQIAPIGVSGHGSTAPSNARTEETSSTPSATVTESSLGITSTKGALSPVTSEQNTQEGITSSSNQTTLNDVTAADLSHSSLHSTAETPSTDTEKSALPVSTVILDSSTVASSATSHFTTNIPPQTEVSQITGTSNTVPNTVPMGSTSSDTTDTESNTPPAFTDKVSSTASVASELGDKSTAFVGTNPISHLSTTAETPAEISSNSPATTGFSKETTLPLSTTSTRDGTATLNPLATESSTSSSSSPVSESASQASEQTAPIGVSGHGSTAPSNARTEETSSTPSATVTESSLGITSTKGALSPVTSEQNTSTVIVATIVTAGDTSSKNTKPTVRITAPEAGTVSSMTENTLPQGTCTSLIFSIQLEKVTSEVIQLNWTPQGGTRDSPYTVYLLRDNTVRNKSTTNKTRIAFGDLVPGYEYIISVEVLTCAKKINTSKRVRTEAKTFDGKTRITNENFKPEYNNKSSEEFKDFEKKFIGEIRKNLPPEMQRLLDEGKMRIVINNLRSGSIFVDFMIVLDVGENVTKTELTAAFTEAFNNSTEFQTDRNSTLIEGIA
nr:cell wall protein IFF6-like [Chrysemys picta bellii]